MTINNPISPLIAAHAETDAEPGTRSTEDAVSASDVRQCSAARWRGRDRAPSHDQAYFVGYSRLKTCSARPVHDAAPTRPNQKLELMGTELLIVAVTVSFYALCALFVRVCDRI